ncbi:MAG: PID-CTERM protein-sorting domain-containing protein [Bacteroidia bacterium]|jgi:hypothetical protein
MNKKLPYILSLVCVFVGINGLFATPVPPGPTIIPVDGGLSLLIAACVGVGAKKLYDYKNTRKSEE